MLLHIRHGSRLYEVNVPCGCRIEPTANGQSVLMIPGSRPDDTSTRLPARLIVSAARLGEYGLNLRGEQMVKSKLAQVLV